MNNNCDDHDTYHIFNLIGQHTELHLILSAASTWLESRISNVLVAIMLYSEQEQILKFTSGKQNFSKQYGETIDNINIAPDERTCGRAAYLRKMVVSENLLKDIYWTPYQASIKLEKLCTCWSTPILSARGTLYGTFATYYRTLRKPTDHNIKLLKQAAAMVALAIELDLERKQRIAISEKYSSFYTYHPDAIFEIDTQGIMVSTNIASRKIIGFSDEQIRGKHYSSFLPAEYRDIADKAFKEAMQGNAQYYEIPAYHASGEMIWLDLTNLPIKQNHQVTGVFGIARDITLRRKNQEHLRLLKRGVNASPNGIIITDATTERKIVYVNPAFLHMTGYTEEDVMGKTCHFLQGPETEAEKIALVQQALKEHKEIQVTVKNYRKDGSWFWNRLMLGPVFDEAGRCTHFLGIQEDITQQRIHEDYITHQHSHDHLTGLANRQTFETNLQQAFETQHHSSKPLFLCYIDLDDFKPLNDSLGHLIGDQIIKSVSDRLQALLQTGDFLGRFAGDEFALLMVNRNKRSEVITTAEEILKLFTQPFQIDEHKIHLSASIGIVADDCSIQRSSELLYHAVLAMKEAKRQGRNTWHWYEKANKKVMPEIDYAHLRLELMEALNDNQFNLFYQPLINPATGLVKGVEALIRWNHPQRGYIFPDIFIPLAERTGQIVAIGQWVLKKACMDIAEWNKTHQSQLTVSVNISPLQFRRAGFLQELEHALDISTLTPELLKIEVTEGMVIIGADRAIEILKSIRELGVQVSIDDFGTGYSSLSYLRRLPINQIKLDRSFIEHLTESDQDAAIVQSIIHLAHQLNLEVVAEGVETLKQAAFLYQQGCDLLQGYFYARPAPITELKTIYISSLG